MTQTAGVRAVCLKLTARSESGRQARRCARHWRPVNEARISLENFKIPGFRSYDREFAEPDSVLDQSNRNFMEFVKRDIELGFTFLQTSQVEKDMGESERAIKACKTRERL
jgi:hypothetical protein